MLDDRKTAILRAVVEEYIATAQPVGSAHIANNRDLAVSSATVRNDMAALEREGYLMHPHTSAGRIPTDKGYRFFVDNLVPNGSLGSIEQAKVGSFFETAHFRLEETLQRTSMLLAQLTKSDCRSCCGALGSVSSTFESSHHGGCRVVERRSRKCSDRNNERSHR
ncbi:MAG: heat-inducible transcription repressor HrcA [Actinomycetota bacterium]